MLSGSAAGAFLGAQYDHYDTTTETLDKPTDVTSEIRQVLQIQTYTLNLDRSLYPQLRLNLGGVFKDELDETDQDGTDLERKQETLSPRVGLIAGGRPVSLGIDYSGLRRRRSSSAAPTTDDTRDTYSLFGAWYPNQRTELNLRLTEQQFENDPKTVDRDDRSYSFRARYQDAPWLLEYNLTLVDQQNELSGSELEQTSNEIYIDYRKRLDERDMDVAATYRGSTTHSNFSTPTATDLQLPVTAGLDSLDETPENGELDENAELIDGNTETATDLNIGKSGNPAFLTNIGVDFGSPTTVTRLYVYVDRDDLPAEVTDSFTWSVYTSEDNTPVSVWQLHSVAAPAVFNSVQSRFEIVFPFVNTRYIKVAVTPLSITVPGPYDDIFVTELEAWVDVSRNQIDYRTFFHNGNLSLNKRLSDRTRLTYNGALNHNRSTLNDADDTRLSNTVLLSHRFDPVYSGSLRASLSKSWKSVEADRIAFEYGATGRADYLETLSMTLGFSGDKISYDDGRNAGRDSLSYRLMAELYRGADVDANVAYSLIEEFDGRLSGNFVVGLGLHLEPHHRFDFRGRLQQTENREIKAGDRPGTGAASSRYADLQLTLRPLQRVTLLGQVTYRESNDISSSLKRFTVNWSALSEGELKLFVTYHESYRTEQDQVDKFLSPGLSWRISQYLSLQMRYNWFLSDSDLVERDGETFNGTISMRF